MGRPKTPIDPEQVRALAEIQCNYVEMASVLKTSRQVLQRRFHRIVEEGWQAGRTNLRREQMKAALAGNVVMMIWLGKQYLGQADKLETDNVNVNIEQLDDAALLERGRQLFARAGATGIGAALFLPAPAEPSPVPRESFKDKLLAWGELGREKFTRSVQDRPPGALEQAAAEELSLLGHKQKLRNGRKRGVVGKTQDLHSSTEHCVDNVSEQSTGLAGGGGPEERVGTGIQIVGTGPGGVPGP
jgi:hypothetical protein